MIILLVTKDDERRDHLIFLSGVFVTTAMWYLNLTLTKTGFFENYPALIGWPTFLVPLFAPTIFFYIHTLSTTRKWHFKNHSYFHWIAGLAVILMDLPHVLSPAESKLANLHMITDQPHSLDPVIAELSYYSNVCTVLLFGFYLVLTIKRLHQHGDRIQHVYSNLGDRTLKWIQVYVLFVVSLLALGISNLLQYSDQYNWILHIICVTGFSIMSLRQKPVFEISNEKITTEQVETTEKAKKKHLSPERRALIAGKLRTAFEKDHLYRDPDLTLRKLSDAVGFSTHHISEALRDDINMNFYDYVNKCRINEACDLLISTDTPTIDIAFEVGFNSRSTFSTAFKKHQNTTPAAYRKGA
ncbi:helix-turn-helix domain-containing protein [Pseudemcibacter aquimaris]|nr:helix-turn-helix transcriptional regulator [Pseudemcibacter aquimaris]WDU57722.1 helix-turn-helix transcriptional regulator [Pseudemcibacter aquimaris]